MPVADRILFVALIRESYAPVKVLLGFDGYATEVGLREALVDIVEANVCVEGDTSPERLPSLITSNSFSLVKCTGQPYLANSSDGSWVVVASARHNPARVLLEFIWTRIAAFCKVRMPFGPEMDEENLSALLVARGASRNGVHGWEVQSLYASEKTLHRSELTAWEPTKLSPAALAVAQHLAFRGDRLDLSERLSAYIAKEFKVELDHAVEELVATGTFCRAPDALVMVSSAAFLACLDDGTGYTDLDLSRLQAWCTAKGLGAGFVSVLKVD